MTCGGQAVLRQFTVRQPLIVSRMSYKKLHELPLSFVVLPLGVLPITIRTFNKRNGFPFPGVIERQHHPHTVIPLHFSLTQTTVDKCWMEVLQPKSKNYGKHYLPVQYRRN
ncbi:hypothetical protein EDC04DRAFT_1694688 [Pisolithus marmoratus]|nr:hypothetical protein EDC04DRAFT_1694688 [Pisolithus marmoratus]